MLCCYGVILNGQATSLSAAHFAYTEAGRQIYQDIIDLKLDEAQQQLNSRIAAESKNLSYLHLQSYLDFFTIFISEDKSYFDKVQKRKSAILKSIAKQLSDTDPYKKFALAEIKLHSAISRSKFGQVFKSAKEILEAYKLLIENQNNHPEFILNKKSLSVIHSLAETVSIPGIVKKLFGIKGTIAQGLSEIEEVIVDSHEGGTTLFKEEIDAIYLYMLMYQAHDFEAVRAYLPKSRLDPSSSLLSTFMIAKIYEKLGQNDKAIDILSAKPEGEEYASFLYLELLEGTCRLRAMDVSCSDFLLNYINGFKGRHFIKEAYQKLAWAQMVFHEDIASYKYFISKAQSEGEALVDDDKQAERESKALSIPDPDLLKARLLSDGGYHQKAYTHLVQKAYKFSENNNQNHLEFNYRMGRICQALRNYPEALDYYQITIKAGNNSAAYYACNAALQSGLIHEAVHDRKAAEEAFMNCLALKPEEYKSSLHQKAKTGLLRLSEKR